MKTAKITKCEFKNEWANPKGGSIFYHAIELDNGDKGQIGAKQAMPDKLSVGSELTYTIEGDKIKSVQQMQQPFSKGGGGKGYTPEPFEHKAAPMSLGFAKDLACAGVIKPEQVLTTANFYFDWLISKKVS